MLGRSLAGNAVGKEVKKDGGGKKKGISKRVEEDLKSAADSGLFDGRSPKRKDGGMMRMDSNTVDIRGLDIEDAMSAVRDFFGVQMRAGRGTVYVLHGHGTKGVLKKKIREALKREEIV